MTLHTELSGAVLYVWIEHTRNAQEQFDVARFNATLADGEPLPSWLILDREQGLISGVPPADQEYIRIKVQTYLQDGHILSGYYLIEPHSGRIDAIAELNGVLSEGAPLFRQQVSQAFGRFETDLVELRKALGD